MANPYIGTYGLAQGLAPQGSQVNNTGYFEALTLPEQLLYNATHRAVIKWGDLGWQQTANTDLALSIVNIPAGWAIEGIQTKLITPFVLASGGNTSLSIGDIGNGATQFVTLITLTPGSVVVRIGTRLSGFTYYAAADVLTATVGITGNGTLGTATQGEVHFYLRIVDGNALD